MRELHESIKHTATEMTIKESEGFRVRLEKWQAASPKNLYSIDIIQESLDNKGEVTQSSTYSFNMTKEELQSFAYGLTV